LRKLAGPAVVNPPRPFLFLSASCRIKKGLKLDLEGDRWGGFFLPAGRALWLVVPDLSFSTAYAQPGPAFEAESFRALNLGYPLPGLEALTFKNIEKHTVYSLVKDGDTVVVKAESRASASGLIREIRIDPKEYSLVRWRWKVENILKKGDVRKKEGDDYPARIYITFEYDPEKLSFSDRVKFGLVKAFYGQYPPWRRSIISGKAEPRKGPPPQPFHRQGHDVRGGEREEKLGQW